MEPKLLNEKINYQFNYNFELINSLKSGYNANLIEQLNVDLNEVHASLKERIDMCSTILNSLNASLNPYAYKVCEEMVALFNELDMMNRKSILNFNAEYLELLCEQRNKLVVLVDQSLCSEKFFKNNSKCVKFVEEKQSLYRKLSNKVENQIDELFLNDDLFSNLMDRNLKNQKISKDFLNGLLHLVDEFAKRRTKLANDWKFQNLKELFDQTLNAFTLEFRKSFKANYKSIRQYQKERNAKRAKEKSRLTFKDIFNESKIKTIAKFDQLEKEFNEQIKNQLDTLNNELNDKIFSSIQQTCDSIIEESKPIVETGKVNQNIKQIKYRELVNESLAFKESFNMIYSMQTTLWSKRQNQVNELKSKFKEFLTKLVAAKFS